MDADKLRQKEKLELGPSNANNLKPSFKKPTQKAYFSHKRRLKSIRAQAIARSNIKTTALEKIREYKKNQANENTFNGKEKMTESTVDSSKSENDVEYWFKSFFEKHNGTLWDKSWAHDHMKGFHEDMEQTLVYQCEGCKEARLRSAHLIPTDGKFWCTPCKNDLKRKEPLRMGSQKNGHLKQAPECIQRLSPVEVQLISRGCPIGKVYHLPGGQLGYKGHVINIAQDVQALATALPRLPKEIETFIVCKPGKNITNEQLVVRRKYILEALQCLKENNIMYRDFKLDDAETLERLNQLPENGIPIGFRTIEDRTTEDKENGANDQGPTDDHFQIPDEEKISSESFFNNTMVCRTEKEKIAMSFQDENGGERH